MSSDLKKADTDEDKNIIENKKENIETLDKNNNNQNEDKKEEEIKNDNKDLLGKAEFSKIIGNYLLFDQIGMGSFSKVTKAIHLITEQTVEVKILEKEKIEDEIDIERIIREIEILKTIMHPNIAQIYETYSTVHNIYLMMEYVEGGDLFDYITKNIYLSEPIACHIYRQIISVLDYLAEMGISHRDIKPENILLDESHKNIKVIDFGLSNYCKNKELLISSCGSPCYASPEMLSGKPYRGVTTDLWSSGVVLYSMLVGSLPFDDQEIQKLYDQIKIGKFYLPSTLSLEAIDLLKKILEVNPKKRISLKKIKEHPWFNKTQNPLYKGIIYNADNINENKFPYDDKVISFIIKEFYLDDKNINEEKLIEMIEKHEINQYTATYYIAKKNILKIEDNNYEINSNTEKSNKILLKLENQNNKEEKHKKELSRNDKKEKENKRSNTEDNMIINKDKNPKKYSKKKYKLFSNINKQATQDNKDKNNLKEDLSNIKKDIPKIDLKNIGINNPSFINNNNEYTMRGISPPNNLDNLDNIFTLNSKIKNYNNPINILKTEESQRNEYNNKTKNKKIILTLSKTDENKLFDKDKKHKQNKSNGPIIKDHEGELKIGHNLNRKKKANSHRKKYLNMIPKLNISNTNISNNNYKKNKNIYIMNSTSNNQNINNNSNYNNPKVKNSFNFYNFNKNINLIDKNKNYIFSYLKTNLSQNKENHHQRNLSNDIKSQIHITKNTDNNKILFNTKLGILSKINVNNTYNNKKNLSRNNNINFDMNKNRTKNTNFKKSLEKNHLIITPRTLEPKSTTNRIKNIDICQNFKGIINFNNKNSGNKNMNKININGINLNNINSMENDNNSFGLNNNFINKCYLNRGNIINNNNNIILNIQNYYNRKNNKNETINLCKDNINKK